MEININYYNLLSAINTMKKIESGTGYSLKGTADFVNHSKGKMADSINQCYQNLMQIETVLISVIEKTNDVLNYAGISFENAEAEILKIEAEMANIIDD